MNNNENTTKENELAAIVNTLNEPEDGKIITELYRTGGAKLVDDFIVARVKNFINCFEEEFLHIEALREILLRLKCGEASIADVVYSDTCDASFQLNNSAYGDGVTLDEVVSVSDFDDYDCNLYDVAIRNELLTVSADDRKDSCKLLDYMKKYISLNQDGFQYELDSRRHRIGYADDREYFIITISPKKEVVDKFEKLEKECAKILQEFKDVAVLSQFYRFWKGKAKSKCALGLIEKLDKIL